MPVISPISQTVSNALSTVVISGKLFLLQQYSGAAAAYSLRDLAGDSPSVVRVRRSSDNTEQDFTANQINDGSLVSFVGAGDGLVTTWYDQSGNGNDATQDTAASQPKIVDGGVLVTENGKAAINFDGVWLQSELNLSTVNDSDSLSGFTVFSSTENVDGNARVFASNNLNIILDGQSNNSYRFLFRDVSDEKTVNLQESYLFSFFSKSDSQTENIYWNSDFFSSKSFSRDNGDFINDFAIGSEVDGVNAKFIGTISELILYPSDQSANRVGIESNINDYYGVY